MCNNRATIVIGYCPMEVLGTSAYDYCHMLDVQKLTECHKNGKHLIIEISLNKFPPLTLLLSFLVIETKLPIAISYRFITKGEQALLVTANFNYQDKPIGISCTVTPGLVDSSLAIDKNLRMQSTSKVGILEMDSIGHESTKRRRPIESSTESVSGNNPRTFLL